VAINMTLCSAALSGCIHGCVHGYLFQTNHTWSTRVSFRRTTSYSNECVGFRTATVTAIATGIRAMVLLSILFARRLSTRHLVVVNTSCIRIRQDGPPARPIGL